MADPEVDPLVRPAVWLAMLALLLAALAGTGGLPGAAAASVGPGASSSSPVVGNLTGPSLVATSVNATYYLNVSGGPAEDNGTIAGTISWNASLVGANTSSTAVTPSNGTITGATSQPIAIVVSTGKLAQPLTLLVQAKSTLGSESATGNFTRTFLVVVPYVLRATLVAGPTATVLPFNVSVLLDGTRVATVQVPKLAPNGTYFFAYRYPSTGLSSGYHTFELVIAVPHGLVTFGNGLTVQSTTFYVAPAPPNNTIWVVVGFVAFFGVLFIYATRVAARRRGSGRR